ncbi:MAG: hypothetical protein PHF86_04420 [Candidatus Nanoarchaeia archaeon]|nr:hypothetical protein [Candidatus Nanoarchaeia archaeon]
MDGSHFAKIDSGVDALVAEFEGVTNKKRSSDKDSLPAKLETLSLIRHKQMTGKSDKIIENISSELEIDKKLGLKNQAELTALKALNHDINELTSSRDFFEVSQDLIKKLFQINKLKRKCFINNIVSKINAFFITGALPLSIHLFMLLTIYPILKFSMWIWPAVHQTPTTGLITLSVFNCISWICMLGLLIAGFTLWEGRSIEYTLIDVNINSIPLSKVTDKIPYGAKLKVLEAKETGIFEDFVFITPEFVSSVKHHNVSFPSVDPAILGVTTDKRMYMIVYWDIEKDVAKVVKEIEHFKKFKLHKNC